MPILDYAQWFGEAVNDPHGAGFGPVLDAYRASADNAAALAELNSTWAEDEDLNPMLGIDVADGYHMFRIYVRYRCLSRDRIE